MGAMILGYCPSSDTAHALTMLYLDRDTVPQTFLLALIYSYVNLFNVVQRNPKQNNAACSTISTKE